MSAEGIGVFNVSTLVAELCKQVPEHFAFEPTDVQLSHLVISTTKADEETLRFVCVDPQNQPPICFLHSQFPLDVRVVAMDSTSVVLGYVPEGLVGA
jgi:hypothetical protein